MVENLLLLWSFWKTLAYLQIVLLKNFVLFTSTGILIYCDYQIKSQHKLEYQLEPSLSKYVENTLIF